MEVQFSGTRQDQLPSLRVLERGDELDLKNLQAAQERFIEKMMKFIPEEFKSNKKIRLKACRQTDKDGKMLPWQHFAVSRMRGGSVYAFWRRRSEGKAHDNLSLSSRTEG